MAHLAHDMKHTLKKSKKEAENSLHKEEEEIIPVKYLGYFCFYGSDG